MTTSHGRSLHPYSGLVMMNGPFITSSCFRSRVLSHLPGPVSGAASMATSTRMTNYPNPTGPLITDSQKPGELCPAKMRVWI